MANSKQEETMKALTSRLTQLETTVQLLHEENSELSRVNSDLQGMQHQVSSKQNRSTPNRRRSMHTPVSRMTHVDLGADEPPVRFEWEESYIKLAKKVNKARRTGKYLHTAEDTKGDIATPLQAPLADKHIYMLPRGGVYVITSVGPIQIGIPPETIKDSLNLNLPVPTNYVIPRDRFDFRRGITTCEVEFPAYYNFFLLKKRVNLICTKEVQKLLHDFVDETLEGPTAKNLFVDEEYGQFCPPEIYAARPNHEKELGYFKEPRDGIEIKTDTLVQFTTLQHSPKYGDQLVAKLEGGVEIVDTLEEYVVIDNGKEIARIDSLQVSHCKQEMTLSPFAVPTGNFDPPVFGVTVMGSSHGFDKRGTTSGFVLWMNGRGIMVDPPPHSHDLLLESGILPRHINTVILTHAHADHDSGTFQKILQEGRVRVITTKTIIKSFIRKYSLLSGLGENFLFRLFEFYPVQPCEPFHWHGGILRFFYSLHALPCIGFEAICSGRSFAYSADTYFVPEGLQHLHERGILSAGRRDALLNFPWSADVIFHEAGVPPIHTPISVLELLPDDVKERLYIIHVAADKAAQSTLKLAATGIDNTIAISTKKHQHERATAILQLLESTHLFSHLSIHEAADMLHLCDTVAYPMGTCITKKGDAGRTFFLILSGCVGVQVDGVQKFFTQGDYLGEIALLGDGVRTATIVAISDVQLIELDQHAFRYLIQSNPALKSRIERLSIMRCSTCWSVLESNSVFKALSSPSKTHLQSLMILRKVYMGETLWCKGETPNCVVFIGEGRFNFLELKDMMVEDFTSGAFIGECSALEKQVGAAASLIAATDGIVFMVQAQEFMEFLDDNPGLHILLVTDVFCE